MVQWCRTLIGGSVYRLFQLDIVPLVQFKIGLLIHHRDIGLLALHVNRVVAGAGLFRLAVLRVCPPPAIFGLLFLLAAWLPCRDQLGAISTFRSLNVRLVSNSDGADFQGRGLRL